MQTFEPDQLVLVREKRETVWRLTHYSHRIQGGGALECYYRREGLGTTQHHPLRWQRAHSWNHGIARAEVGAEAGRVGGGEG